MSDIEDAIDSSFIKHMQAAHPRFVELIQDVTGWRGVDELADWMVRLLISNRGSSSMDEVRPPCWQEHTPQTVAQHRDMLVQVSGRTADDPIIQKLVDDYRQKLRDQFGL